MIKREQLQLNIPSSAFDIHQLSYFLLSSGIDLSVSLSSFTDRITSNKKSYIAHTSIRILYDPFESILLCFIKNLYKADDALCNSGFDIEKVGR